MYATIRTYLKNTLIRLLESQGYSVFPASRFHDPKEYALAKKVRESQYYAVWNGPCPLFSPWLGHPDFQNFYQEIKRHTIVPPDRCYILMALARYALGLPGDFAECGVYKGGTALLFSRLAVDSRKRVYLFDSFKGLPKVDLEKDFAFSEGEFANTGVDAVQKLLGEFGASIVIREGWIPETFTGLEQCTFSFVHMDVDLYQSTLDCCAYFYPRLSPGGVMVFDEYAFPGARGEKEAVDEFFIDKTEKPITLPTGQAILLKLPAAWHFPTRANLKDLHRI